jgi:hypothetical protein
MTGTPEISGDALLEGAAAICIAEHRHNQDPKEPPCGNCYAIAETVLLAAWPRLHADAASATRRRYRHD